LCAQMKLMTHSDECHVNLIIIIETFRLTF